MVSSAFPAGSEVEVRSNEEGFKGAWFEATVVKSLPKYRRYTVVYSTLVSDEITAKPLEDTVYCSFVRPRPTPRWGSDARFELHQLVEAFHNDGWWKGVVSEVPDRSDGLYRVCFPTSREEFEFKGDELREQLEWVKGNWVAVQDQEVEEEDLTFVVGSRVEVSRDKENYGAAWFVGTVLKVIGKSHFLVEYESLRIDNDGSSGVPLKEIVDLQYIRPSPPPSSKFDGFFDVLEEVEAFHKGGWLAGVVMGLPCDSKYIVKSTHHEEEFEVDRTTIRPRFDWTNDHWVRISREKSSKSPGSRGRKSYSHRRKSLAVIRSTFPISAASFSDNDGEAGGRSDAASLKVKSEGPKVEDRVEISQPRKKMKRGNSLEEHLKLVDGTKSVGRRCKQRSRSGKRSSLSTTVLSSSNNNGDVADRFIAVNLNDKKALESPSEERVKSSQPAKNAEKGKPIEHLQLVDSTLMDSGSKTPRNIGKSSSGRLIAEGIPALVTEECHSKRPSRQKVGKKSLSLSTNELHHEQDAGDGIESINSVEGSSSFSVDVSEHQLKTGNSGHSPVRDEPVDFLPVADWINHKGGCALTGNAKRGRKKLVIRATHRERKIPNFVDAKQYAQVELKRKRGRPSKKKIMHMDGMESKQSEEMKEVQVGAEGRREFGEPSNGPPTVDVPQNVKSVTVDVPHNIKSVCLDNVMKCNKSLMTINTKGNTPYICLCNMQADIMEDSPEMPEIEPSTVVAKLFKYSTIQRSPILESFNCKIDETEAELRTQARPSEQDNIGDHDKLIPNGLENVIEMDRSVIDPSPDGLSLLKEYDAFDQNEVTTIGSLSEKAFVEIEDRAPIDHSPSGSSISKGDYVPNHDEFTPGGSLSEKTCIEMEKTPSDLTPSGSLPSKEDIRDPDELAPSGLPAEKAIVEVEGRTEIDSMPIRSLSNEVTLPFIKESGMWEIVESMEVFRTMPQQPHFHPLEQYEIEFREGMAIGLMVTFANLVDSVQKLRVDDSQGIFEEKLRALIPLELNGFNVHFLRSRLEKLQEIQSNASESEGKKVSLKEKIMEGEEEKDQLDALVAAHDKIIMELEENIYRYRERRQSVLLGRDRKESEIGQLKINLQATEEAYFSAKEHFNAALDAPWEM